MAYMDLMGETNIEEIDGKVAAILSTAMACEIMQMVIKSSLSKLYGISDEKFIAFTDELSELKTNLVRSLDYKEKDTLHLLKDSAYLCKRVHKIGSLLKSNSDTTLRQDLDIAIQLSQVSLNGLIGLLKEELRQVNDAQIKKQLESHIEILVKEDKFYKKLMGSPDY